MSGFSSYLRRFFSKKNYSIRLLQFNFLTIVIVGFIKAPASWLVAGLFGYAFFETFAGNIGLHRYFGHRSFKTNRAWHWFFAFVCHYIGVGSVVSWVGQHRYHHLHSDTPVDVHSPEHNGIFHIMFGIWKVKIELSMIRDVLKDPILMFFHRHYFKMHMLIFLFWLSIDLTFGTWFLFATYALPNLMCLLSGYMLAIVPHMRGYKNHQIGDKSLNCWITNIYTLGEGWHNNHHAIPNRLRQGEHWWEWDLPAFVVENFVTTKVDGRSQ